MENCGGEQMKKTMLFKNGKLCGFLGNEKKFYGLEEKEDLFKKLKIKRLL